MSFSFISLLLALRKFHLVYITFTWADTMRSHVVSSSNWSNPISNTVYLRLDIAHLYNIKAIAALDSTMSSAVVFAHLICNLYWESWRHWVDWLLSSVINCHLIAVLTYSFITFNVYWRTLWIKLMLHNQFHCEQNQTVVTRVISKSRTSIDRS